jgi:hypothetical protein
MIRRPKPTIPKTTSGPANPDQPSFLTTLPPEIRNHIYELLLKRDEPVLLHDGKAYRESLYEKLREDAQEEDEKEYCEEPEFDVEQYVKDDEFHHGFGESIGLLLSCRQIYHEAAGILFGHNTFLFSRVLDMDDRRSVFYNQCRSAATWLERIGSQFALLSRVQIDADACCPRTCGFNHRSGHRHSPFLFLIWANPSATCEITYVHTGRFLDRSLHYDDYDDEDERKDQDVREHADFPTDVLNNLLVTLGKNDALNIKQHARYGRLLDNVVLEDAAGVFSVFVTYHGHHQYYYSNVMDRGKKVEWKKEEGPPLLDLPLSAKFLIHTYACTSDEVVVFDLDSKKAPGLQLGLHGVNKQLRYSARFTGTWKYNNFALKMTTHEASTDFHSSRAL